MSGLKISTLYSTASKSKSVAVKFKVGVVLTPVAPIAGVFKTVVGGIFLAYPWAG
jgi:hypothetical protein